MRALGAVLLCAVLGCVDSSLTVCGDTLCPLGNVCTAGGCASPADVEACTGLGEGAPCRAANGSAGVCQGGACGTGLCGNGRVDVLEECDDGNQMSGDGCRADCGKAELCGDSFRDTGEQCDDGNVNPADGCDACVAKTWVSSAIVGSAQSATMAGGIARPVGVAADGQGRVLVVDAENHRIRRVDTDGTITIVAGSGTRGYEGDGEQATSARLDSPGHVAVDGLGRVFIADTANHRIRRVDRDGTIRTIAGTGASGSLGDGGPATNAQLNAPRGVAVDGLGRVFIADRLNFRIRVIDVDGTINTVAGTGVSGVSVDGTVATNARLVSPSGLAIDAVGRVVIADVDDHRIRRIELDGTLTTVAGAGTPGLSGDGGAAITAQLFSPFGVSFDGAGQMLIADSGNHRIRRVDANGMIQTIAGVGAFGGSGGYDGDGRPAIASQLQFPFDVVSDSHGNILIADTLNLRIRAIGTDGILRTVAGSGAQGTPGDGRAATSAPLAHPSGLAADEDGRWIVADSGYPDTGPFNNCVRRIDVDGTITTVAGQAGSYGFAGDGGPATLALLSTPRGVAVDGQRRILIADTGNHAIRRVDTTGGIRTIAGVGTFPGFSGDLGLATSAMLRAPVDIAVDAPGRVIVADAGNHAIRRILLDGTIRTIAGTGTAGIPVEGAAANTTRLSNPSGVGVDHLGRVLIADTGNHAIRRIELDATIATLAGTGMLGYAGDGAAATAAQLNAPSDVAVDAMGRILIADSGNHAIRRIDLDGVIRTIAGTGAAGSTGDGAQALQAQLRSPVSLALHADGTVVFADALNNRLRSIDGDGIAMTIAGAIDPGDTGPTSVARLATPQAIQVGVDITVVAGGASGTVEAVRNGRVEVVAGRYPQSVATADLARFRQSDFGAIGGVAYDASARRMYLSETSAHRIHVVTLQDPGAPNTWTIAPLANFAGSQGFADGAAASARFRSPSGLILDRDAHILYIADTGNHAVRALDLEAHTVRTILNSAHRLGYAGDGGPATAALAFRPTAITRCGNGHVFVADSGNHRVRRIDNEGVIRTVLGDGTPASSGEGAPAHSFPVNDPRGVSCDRFGNLFVTSSTTIRMLPASDAGVVDGTGSVKTIYGATRINFPESITSCLTGIESTASDTLQVADGCSGLLVELRRQ